MSVPTHPLLSAPFAPARGDPFPDRDGPHAPVPALPMPTGNPFPPRAQASA